MRMLPFPSRLLNAGVAPFAAVMVIAVAAPGTTVLAASAPQSAVEPPALTATPIDDAAPLAAPVRSSVADLETEAVALADEFGAVPVDESGALCPTADLAVRWSEPEGYTHGAYVAPVGPRPADGAERANGVVVCAESTWAFMGFEATHDDATWTVTAVPYVNEEEAAPQDLNLDAEVDERVEAAPAPAKPAPGASTSPKATVETSAWLAGLGPIEPYAAYEPQSSCSPTAKPGTTAMKDTLLSSYPATRNLGIARACHLGGRSEHKEGRAFDWGAYVNRVAERGSVDQFLTQLLATDADGNRHALARRMGVMYVIWNGQIWSAYRPGDGWRRYGGPNPHTDHVHVSLSRAGGAGRTSFFTNGLAAKGVLREVPPGASPINTAAVVAAPSGGTKATPVAARTTTDTRRDRQATGGEQPRPRRREFTAEQRAAWEAMQQAADAERQARRERRRDAEEAGREQWQAHRESEAARRAEWRQRREQAEAQEREQRQARRQAEETRRAEWQQRREQAEAQQREQWQARREQAEAERRAQQQRRKEAEETRRAEWRRQKEAAEAAWRERHQRRQPAPSPSPTTSPTPAPTASPSPSPEPAPSASDPTPAPTESAPAGDT